MLGIIPVAEVLDMLTPDDETPDGYTVRDILDHKRQSEHYTKLCDAIRRDGIALPVMIRTLDGQPWLADGHHRVAAAIDLGLAEIPWTDDTLLADRIETMPCRLTPGRITPAAVEVFTRGACAGLAVALQDATGWPIIEIGHCDGLPLHFMVRHPNGCLVDIRGAHSGDDVGREWEFDADNEIVTLAEVTRAAALDCYLVDCGEPVPLDLVRTFVPAVIALVA
ncbi:ParB/Srx family N-terminal domain-containing protein [Streptomyces sp. B21-083]|uniref:ParB/Srx family N-terminal domain-containing protein n=1 Tax=Streptomyces sp. B21-083 TaxID=3039410 RepID=UPI002FEF9DCC